MKQVKNYIKLYTDVVDSQLCNEMINYEFNYEKSAYSTHSSGKVVKLERVSSVDCWIKKRYKFYTRLKETYEKVIKLYQEDFTDFTVQRHTDFRISKYSKSCFMSKHIDLIHHSHGQQYGYPQVTVLLFLNDDYEGGEIVIADNIYKPPAGSGIVFPSNFMYPHEVSLVKEGTRYSVTCWLM